MAFRIMSILAQDQFRYQSPLKPFGNEGQFDIPRTAKVRHQSKPVFSKRSFRGLYVIEGKSVSPHAIYNLLSPLNYPQNHLQTHRNPVLDSCCILAV